MARLTRLRRIEKSRAGRRVGIGTEPCNDGEATRANHGQTDGTGRRRREAGRCKHARPPIREQRSASWTPTTHHSRSLTLIISVHRSHGDAAVGGGGRAEHISSLSRLNVAATSCIHGCARVIIVLFDCPQEGAKEA